MKQRFADVLRNATLYIAIIHSILISMSNLVYAEDMLLSDVKKLYKEAVVFIAVDYETSEGKGCEVGTGFLISSSGYVITSRHLITDTKFKQYQKYTMAASVGEPFACEKPRGVIRDLEYIHSIADQDVMLLKFQSDQTYNYVRACKQTVVADGEKLFILGYPLGAALTPTEVTRGHTSGIRGRWQITGSINEGNSGGPVFNSSGRLVGLVYGEYGGANQYGFMIPLDHFKPLFTFAAASLENCETPAGNYSEGRCPFRQKIHEINFTLAEHIGVSSNSKDFSETIPSESGFIISSWDWRPSSVNNASGIDVQVAPDKKSIRVNTRLTSGPVFDRWRGWLSGALELKQVPESCSVSGLGVR